MYVLNLVSRKILSNMKVGTDAQSSVLKVKTLDRNTKNRMQTLLPSCFQKNAIIFMRYIPIYN